MVRMIYLYISKQFLVVYEGCARFQKKITRIFKFSQKLSSIFIPSPSKYSPFGIILLCQLVSSLRNTNGMPLQVSSRAWYATSRFYHLLFKKFVICVLFCVSKIAKVRAQCLSCFPKNIWISKAVCAAVLLWRKILELFFQSSGDILQIALRKLHKTARGHFFSSLYDQAVQRRQ